MAAVDPSAASACAAASVAAPPGTSSELSSTRRGAGGALGHDGQAIAGRRHVEGDAAGDDAARQRVAVPGQCDGAHGVAVDVADPRRVSLRARVRDARGRSVSWTSAKRLSRREGPIAGRGLQQRVERRGVDAEMAQAPGVRACPIDGGPRRRSAASANSGAPPLRVGSADAGDHDRSRRRRVRRGYGTTTTISFEAPLTPQAFCARIRT